MFDKILHPNKDDIVKTIILEANSFTHESGDSQVKAQLMFKQKINKKSTIIKTFSAQSLIVQKDNIMKKKRIRKYISKNPKNKKGHWTVEQTLKYHYFLQLNPQYFMENQRRKIDKAFRLMSDFIETREPHQCRSHHQKIQLKWRSFNNILLNLRQTNFKQFGSIKLKSKLYSLGFNINRILSQQELLDQYKLRQTISNERYECISNQLLQQSQYNQIQDFQSQLQSKCQCLMMSQKYQDSLRI